MSAPTNKWLVAASISSGTLMAGIDLSIVNVALPQIQGSVGATLQEITWVSTGYAIAGVLIMPFVAALGRRFGQKRVYMFCLGLFLFGSLLCANARSLPQLIACRVVQGLGGGALQPSEEAILRQTFPREEMGKAMAIAGMVTVTGPALGPVIGGYLVDRAHWSWIFYLSLPVGLAGLCMTAMFLREDPELVAKNRERAAAERENVDRFGIVLLATALAATEWVLEEGQHRDWFADRWVSGLSLLALISAGAFIQRQLTRPAPIVNLSLFRDSRFAIGTGLSILLMGVLVTNLFLLSVFMQELRGFSAVQSGVALLPLTLGMLVGMPIAGVVYPWLSARFTIAAGIVAFAVAAWDLAHISLAMGQWGLARPLALEGLAMALIYVPLETTAFSQIPKHLLADAAGVSNVLKELGGAVGLALFTSTFVRHGATTRAAAAAHLGLTRPDVWSLFQREGLIPFAARVSREAAVRNFQHLFLLSGLTLLVLLPFLFFLKSSPEKAAHE